MQNSGDGIDSGQNENRNSENQPDVVHSKQKFISHIKPSFHFAADNKNVPEVCLGASLMSVLDLKT